MAEYDYTIHYKRYHDGSMDDIKSMGHIYAKMLGPLLREYPRSAKVLDYGCGDGALVHYLSWYFDDASGVDASPEQVETAQEHGICIKHLAIETFVQWCDMHAETFDLVFLFDVLEHVAVKEQLGFMRMLGKTLRPGGHLFIKTPNASSLLASRWRYIDWTHHSSFTEASLDFVLLNTGFTSPQYYPDESQIRPDYWWIPRYSLIRFYLKSLFRQLWRLYLRCELGKEAKSIPTGVNLFARATKVDQRRA